MSYNIICAQHSETSRFCCIDNNCSHKILCPTCVKNSTHQNMLDLQFLIDNLKNYCTANSMEQFDVQYIKVIEGANLQMKNKIFDQYASQARQEGNQKHVDPITKQLEDYLKNSCQVITQFTHQTIDHFKNHIKEICDQTLLQNHQVKILACNQILNNLDCNSKDPLNIFNQNMEDLHKGKLQLDIALLQFNYICQNFEPILTYFCDRTLEYIKKEVKIMEKHLQTLKENAQKLGSKEELSPDKGNYRIRVLNNNIQQHQNQQQQQQTSQKVIEEQNSNRSVSFQNNLNRNNQGGPSPPKRTIFHQKNKSLQSIPDSTTSSASALIKTSILQSNTNKKNVQVNFQNNQNDKPTLSPDKDITNNNNNVQSMDQNILKSLDYTKRASVTEQLFKRKSVLFISPQTIPQKSNSQQNESDSQQEENKSSEYYSLQQKYQSSTSFHNRKNSKNLTLSTTYSQISNAIEERIKTVENISQMGSNTQISSNSNNNINSKRPMIVNPQIQLEDYSPGLRPKSIRSIDQSGIMNNLVLNDDKSQVKISSDIITLQSIPDTQDMRQDMRSPSQDLKKKQSRVLIQAHDLQMKTNLSPSQQQQQQQQLNLENQQIQTLQQYLQNPKHLIVSAPHKQAISDLLKISSDFFISCSLDGTIASWTVERTPIASIKKINEIQAHQSVFCFTQCKTPGMFLTSGIEQQSNSNNTNNNNNPATANQPNITSNSNNNNNSIVSIKLWLYQDSQIILELTDMRGLHSEPVRIMELIKEKYIDQKKSNIKQYSNIIYFLTFDQLELKFKVWQLYFNCSRRHFGEVNNLLQIQLPGKPGSSTTLVNQACNVIKVFITPNNTVFAITEQSLIKFVIAKNYQSATDLQRKVIMTERNEDNIVSMCRTNSLIFVVSKLGSVIVFDFDLNKLMQKSLSEVKCIGQQLDQKMIIVNAMKPVTVYNAFNFNNEKCIFFVRENNKYMLWIVNSDLKKIQAEVEDFAKIINKFLILDDVFVGIEDMKIIRGIIDCKDTFRDYIEM